MKTKALFALFFFLAVTKANAQSGLLDSSFGVNGKSTFSNGYFSEGRSIQTTSDGKILVIGTSMVTNLFLKKAVTIVKYLSNGTIDSSFGKNGIVTASDPLLYFEATTSILQPDGKLIIAGNFSSDFNPGSLIIMRFLINGNLDSSFGINGITFYSFMGGHGKALALQSSGKIILAGTTNSGDISDLLVARFKNDGSLDSSFGLNGINKPFVNVLDAPIGITVQKDNKIIVASGFSGYDFRMCAFRFKKDGDIDSAFGNNGTRYYEDTAGGVERNTGAACSVIIQNNMILLGGYASKNGRQNLALTRFDLNGNIDRSFGINGLAVDTNFIGETTSTSMKVQPDGKILVAGYSWNPQKDYAIGRFDSEGRIDISFGNKGASITNFYNTDISYDMALQADGKILLTGTGNTQYFLTARYFNGNPIINLKKNISVSEGNTGITSAQFKVTLSEASTIPITVQYTTIDGTATAGSDYIASSGTITFKPGQISKNIQMSIIGDNSIESNERFSLQLTNSQNAILGASSSAFCTIKNDDPSFSTSTSNEITLQKDFNVKLYPNPVKDILNIKGLSGATTLSVIDINGKVLATAKTTNNTYNWNIRALPPGNYYLRIEADKKITTIKFIKQ